MPQWVVLASISMSKRGERGGDDCDGNGEEDLRMRSGERLTNGSHTNKKLIRIHPSPENWGPSYPNHTNAE